MLLIFIFKNVVRSASGDKLPSIAEAVARCVLRAGILVAVEDLSGDFLTDVRREVTG